MPITRITTTTQTTAYELDVTVSGLTLSIAETHLDHYGNEFVVEAADHLVTVDDNERTVVTVHICHEIDSDEVVFLVDEYLLGVELPYDFLRPDSPYIGLYDHVCTLLVPPGTEDLNTLELEVRTVQKATTGE